MQGSLALYAGILYVGRHEKTAHVRAYSFDGRPLSPSFSFRGGGEGRAEVAGLCVAEDHTIWVADPVAARVRGFTVFGSEASGFASTATGDRPGSLSCVSDIEVLVRGDETCLVVASSGDRRHALQLFTFGGDWIESLRSEGDPKKVFRDVRRIAVCERLLYVCEPRAGRVQVFRDGEFHFLFRVPSRGGEYHEPRAIVPLSDGRLVLATGGDESALLLLDSMGRFLRVLVEGGTAGGAVFEPNDLGVEDEGPDRKRRLAVIDSDGERVQVFTLEGRCYGAFESMPGGASR